MSVPSSVCLSVSLLILLSPWLCSICQACSFSSSDSRPFLVFASPSASLPTPSIQSTPNFQQQWDLIDKHTCSETKLLFLFCLSLFNFFYYLSFAFLPFSFPLWQKQEPLTWISAGCCCYTQSCFEERKSLILSTIQGSFLVPLIFFLHPRCHPSCDVMSPSLTHSFSRMQHRLFPLTQLSEYPSLSVSSSIYSLCPPLPHGSSLCLSSLFPSPPQLFCCDFSSELPPSSSLFINTLQLPHSTALNF